MNLSVNDLQGTILLTVPHMDDCVLGCGGLLALLPNKDAVHVCYATDGARSPAPAWPWRDPVPADLPAIREAEAVAAMNYLGIATENVHFLNLPDGALQQHESLLRDGLLALIERIQPDYILTPFRYDRHPDHLALNRVVTACIDAGQTGARVLEYFVYHRWRLLPDGDVRRYIRPDTLLVLDTRAGADRKRTALDFFTSQTTVFYEWQTRPNLTSPVLDAVSQDAEMFLPYDPARPGATIFYRLPKPWLLAAHALEPVLKRSKDRLVALVKRGVHG